MNVVEICKSPVVTIRAFEELGAAAQLMRERHVGYLVVTQPEFPEGGDKVVGVLTDRDIVVSVVARNIDPRTLRVEDIMTRQPVTIAQSASVGAALRAMRRIGVRRLPVTGNRGELTGVLSLDDVLDAMSGDLQSVVSSVNRELRTEGALRP